MCQFSVVNLRSGNNTKQGLPLKFEKGRRKGRRGGVKGEGTQIRVWGFLGKGGGTGQIRKSKGFKGR